MSLVVRWRERANYLSRLFHQILSLWCELDRQSVTNMGNNGTVGYSWLCLRCCWSFHLWHRNHNKKLLCSEMKPSVLKKSVCCHHGLSCCFNLSEFFHGSSSSGWSLLSLYFKPTFQPISKLLTHSIISLLIPCSLFGEMHASMSA